MDCNYRILLIINISYYYTTNANRIIINVKGKSCILNAGQCSVHSVILKISLKITTVHDNLYRWCTSTCQSIDCVDMCDWYTYNSILNILKCVKIGLNIFLPCVSEKQRSIITSNCVRTIMRRTKLVQFGVFVVPTML